MLSCEPAIGGTHETGFSLTYSSHISWRSADAPAPQEVYPSRAFDRLFERQNRLPDGPERDAVMRQAKNLMVAYMPYKIHAHRVMADLMQPLMRHFWRHPDVRLDAEDWARLPARFGFDPAQEIEWRDLLTALRRAVDEELTPRQRRVFVAIVLNGVPLDALVIELASNRNAIYKTLFDARRKLRAALAANGYIGED